MDEHSWLLGWSNLVQPGLGDLVFEAECYGEARLCLLFCSGIKQFGHFEVFNSRGASGPGTDSDCTLCGPELALFFLPITVVQ